MSDYPNILTGIINLDGYFSILIMDLFQGMVINE